jgi:hypothetical protein
VSEPSTEDFKVVAAAFMFVTCFAMDDVKPQDVVAGGEERFIEAALAPQALEHLPEGQEPSSREFFSKVFHTIRKMVEEIMKA